MGELWERWDKETSKAYNAFRHYRDTPAKDRSIIKCLASYYGGDDPDIWEGKKRRWEMWASQWNWQDRIRAWEEYQDYLAREAMLEAISEMNNRHAKIAMSVQAKAAERLKTLDPLSLNPREVLSFFVEAARLERSSRGEPESIEERQIKADTVIRQEFTRDQLDSIASIVGVDDIVETKGGDLPMIDAEYHIYKDPDFDEEEDLDSLLDEDLQEGGR